MITRDDIANYIDYVENPDRQILSQTKQGLKALISGKQKDGYYVVVEEAQTKNNRLAFKTMYKVKGDIKESSLFKAPADAENGERLAFSDYKPDAQRIPSLNDHIIPQNSQKVKELPPADLRKAIIDAKDDKERLAIIENQKAGIRQRLENEAAGDKTADKLAKEAQGLADNKPAEKKFTLETIKSFDPRKHGHAYLSKISFNDRKPVREFIDSNTRMWDSKRKYYETSYTFNAKEGDMFEARLDDGSWKSDTKEYYIVKKDDKGELYLSKAKELSDLQKEAIKEAETKSEWESKISSSTDAVKLNKIIRDIEHTEAITPNNRAKLYVAITNRLKELRQVSEGGKVATKNAEEIAPKMSESLKQLKGSEKQIAWANEIRDEFIEKAKDFKSEVFDFGEKVFKHPKYKVLLKGADAADKIYDDYINWILSHDEAKFWIDKRYLSKGGLEDSIRRLGTMTKSKDLLNFL